MAATPGLRAVRARTPLQDVSLLRWVWRAYVRNALVPLLVVELLLVAVYLTSHAWSLKRHVESLRVVARQELARIAQDESAVIELQLSRVAMLIEVLRRRAEDELSAPGSAGKGARALRLAALDQYARDIADASPSILSCEVDTSQATVRRALHAISEAREAPTTQLPAPREGVAAIPAVYWAYTGRDGAGARPTVTALAPVNRAGSLDAVIVSRVAVEQVSASLRGQDVPWRGSAAVIAAEGEPLVFQPAAKAQFGRVELRPVLARVAAAATGWARSGGRAPHLVAWAEIPSTGWKVVALAPEEGVFESSRALSDDLGRIGWVMLCGLLGFYLVYFIYLYRRVRTVSSQISAPLEEIERMARRIAVGEYEHDLPGFEVREFRHTVGELRRMGQLVGTSNRAREAAEARLMERNEELSTILSLSPDGLVSIDAAGRVTETNPAFLGMTGWSRDSLIGLPRGDFWARLGGIGDLGGEDAARPGVAMRVRLREPRPAVLECRVEVARGGGQVAYFRDITHADEVDRAKSRFVATAAHELRTPIAVITGYAEYLQASDPPPAQRGEILATMRRHGDQIAGIVTELLDLARIEARAGHDFTMVRQPLAPLVRRLVDGMRIGEYARMPKPEGDAGEAEVFVDADKFGQALTNVIANACKYSPPGAPVTVRLVAGAAEAGVAVADRGGGMDERTQGRIFEPFYRGESAAGIAGTGLGMSIAKEIMDIHGGRIDVASAPDVGTVVTLWLPRAAPRG
jgi:signal transduction histidine kinase